MSLRVLSVFGTRPEAIKMAPLLLRLSCDARFQSRVCVTGQHRRMLDQVLVLFGIVPDHDLRLMAPRQTLHDLTARVLVGLESVLDEERPDLVIVHGDTTSCMAAALCAFYREVPVAHVEAGLRSHDLSLPFPEEMNRVITDKLASHWLAPTELAREHLLAEGAASENVHVTGNTCVDALLWVRDRMRGEMDEALAAAFGKHARILLEPRTDPMVLVTCHRRESFGKGLGELCLAIRDAAERHPHWLFVFPVHLNPSVHGPVRRDLEDVRNVLLLDPLEYAPFVWLMNRCDVVLTDSGGIQEEAPALGKPVLVTRDVTERPEAITAGTARLVGMDRARIVRGLEDVLLDASVYAAMSRAHNPYGDGRACERIATALARIASADERRVIESAGSRAC